MSENVTFLSISFLIAAASGFFLGVAKSGVKGLAALIVSALAIVYGARDSTGILMPLLICGDIFAVLYYKRHVKWNYIKILIPWMIMGVLIGVVGGSYIDEKNFKFWMGIIILGSTLIMYYWESKKNKKIPSHWSFGGLMGILAGFTTMVGNLAGAFANIYFLTMRLPKNEFIGTAAWLFFIINLFKVPFHIWVWETINLNSIKTSLTLIPYLLAGLIAGVFIVKHIKNESYRKLILILTAIGGLLILLQ